MNKSDFHVGQTVYLKKVYRLPECWKNEYIEEGVVTKIGRKYITVRLYNWDYQFEIDENFRQKTDYSIDFELFLTKQDVRDYWQRAFIIQTLEKIFSYSKISSRKNEISLEKLIAIAKILEIPTNYEEVQNGNSENK